MSVGVSVGDLVRARRGRDGLLHFEGVVQSTDNCTVRIIWFPEGELVGGRGEILRMFEPLGVTGEGIGEFHLVALNVPSGADIYRVKTLIRQGHDQGWWDCEEAAVTDRWLETEPQIRGESEEEA